MELLKFFGIIIFVLILIGIYDKIETTKRKRRLKIKLLERKAKLEKAKSTSLGKYLQEFYLSKDHWDKIYYYQTPSRDYSIIFKHDDGTRLVFQTEPYDENIINLKTTTMLSNFPTVTNKVELQSDCIKEGFSLIEFFRERILLGYEERLKYDKTKQ
jgi:hypothetical protein